MPLNDNLPAFPQTPSAFSDSPLGSNWQLDEKYWRSHIPKSFDQKTQSPDNVDEPFDPHKCQRVLVMHGYEEAIRDWYQHLAIDPRDVAAFFWVDRDLWLKAYDGATSNLKQSHNFTQKSIKKTIGVRLGNEITLKFLTDADLKALVIYLVAWLFIDDSKAQEEYLHILLPLATLEYRLNHPKDLEWYEKLLQYLAMVLGPIILLVMKFIVLLLELLAKILDVLKITDPKHWIRDHKDKQGKNDYAPTFLPGMPNITPSKVLELIKIPFDKIDSAITKFLGSTHKELKGGHETIEDNRWGITKALAFYYEQIKTPFIALYSALHDFFVTAETILYQLNAFLVGVYNGIINFVKGMVEGIKMLFEPGGLEKIVVGIQSLVRDIQEKGFIDFIGDSLNTIFTHLKEKYEHIEDSYDIIKSLGEDIVEIVLNVILAVEAGISLFTKLKEILTKIVNLVKNPAAVLEDFKNLLKKDLKEKPTGGRGPEGKGTGTILGKYSNRTFDIEKAGGELLELSWKEAKVLREGIDTIKKHLSRFDRDPWNERMIERLEKILSKDLEITDFDKRFYTHEIREFERYKALGYENTKDALIPDVWEHAHAATLEEYKVYEKMDFEGKEIHSLFHPDVQFD